MKKEQHHELDEGLVEVETSVGALLKPPESERGGLDPTEPVFKLNRVLLALVLSKMKPTSWRGQGDPPPQGRPPHRPPEPRFEEKTASWTCFFSHLPRCLVFVRVAYSSTSNGIDCISGGDVGSNGCVDGLELVA